MKKNLLYITIFAFWILISILSIWLFIVIPFASKGDWKNNPVVIIFLIINTIFITILFCNSTKDAIFCLNYHLFLKKKQNHKHRYKNLKNKDPKVILLYTTCNDFDANSLLKSSKQNYSNYDVYILDDSYDEKYIKLIDRFVQKNDNFKLIRRENRVGFKAGNINNFLNNENIEYDFFVLLDSDEIIPKDFIVKALDYFYDDKIGVVQANHKGTRGKNLFDSTGELGIFSSWTAFISNKDKYGTVTLNGHGAMVSRECYEKSNGFPHIVAEDLGFTINLLSAGYKIVFANDIICEEVFPIDYLAFKKRSIKWTQGNVEFFKKYATKIFKLKIPFFKKMDLWMSCTSMSLTIFSILIIMINFSILYPLGFRYSSQYHLLVFSISIAIAIIFMLVPIINDFLFLVKKINFFKLMFYIFFCFMLYTSTVVCTIKTLLLSLLGKKAKFIITPKNESRYSFLEAIKYNWLEILIATLLLIWIVIICIYLPEYKFFGIGILSPIILSLYSTIFLTLLSNKRINKNFRNSEK